MPCQLNLSAEKAKFAALTSKKKLTGKLFEPESFAIAISRAVLDITARTLRPVGGYDDNNTLESYLLGKTRDDGSDSLLNRITTYFDNTAPANEEEFDNWHHQTCAAVLVDINKYYKNPSGSPVCYGKAQKIVNMTMKGCYCLDGADAKEEHFKYCHLPLDSFTLEWFYREVVTNWCGDKERIDCVKKINKTKLNSWSNTEYREDLQNGRVARIDDYKSDLNTRTTENGFYHYSFIQDVIRDFFDDAKSKNNRKTVPN